MNIYEHKGTGKIHEDRSCQLFQLSMLYVSHYFLKLQEKKGLIKTELLLSSY